MVSCRTVPLTATSQSVSSRPGTQDFVEKTGQVLRIDFNLKKRLIRSISVSTCKINIIVFYNKAFQDTMKFLILILTSHDVYVHSQIQFEEWQDSKMCNIIINDDSLYEGTETFSVEIFQPIYTLLGRKNRATVSILDSEDGGSIVFLKRSSKAENFLLRFYSLILRNCSS